MPRSASIQPLEYYVEHIFAQCCHTPASKQASSAELRRMKMSNRTNKTALPHDPARRQVMVSAALAVGGLVLSQTEAHANADDPISHTAESIHQEVGFTASPKRVYEALTDAKQFQRVVEL